MTLSEYGSWTSYAPAYDAGENDKAVRNRCETVILVNNASTRT